MDVQGGGERHGSIGSGEEGTSSKRRTSFEEYEDDGVDRRANKSAPVSYTHLTLPTNREV